MDATNLEIRRVTEQDLDQLREISISTFTETFGDLMAPEDMKAYLESAFDETALLREIRTHGSEFHFAESGGRPVAYLKINTGTAQTAIRDSRAFEIQRIYISAEHKGQSIGRMLFEQAVSLARRHSAPFVWLGVWEHNTAAIGFYEKLGMKPSGTLPFTLGNDKLTDILMKLEL